MIVPRLCSHMRIPIVGTAYHAWRETAYPAASKKLSPCHQLARHELELRPPRCRLRLGDIWSHQVVTAPWSGLGRPCACHRLRAAVYFTGVTPSINHRDALDLVTHSAHPDKTERQNARTGSSSVVTAGGRWHAAALFGPALCSGVPYSVGSVPMSTSLGWMLGKAMLETGGFLSAWLIRLSQDVLTVSSVAAGSITPGG
jgi:hypothetical protein